jgi:hypothetical protein
MESQKHVAGVALNMRPKADGGSPPVNLDIKPQGEIMPGIPSKLFDSALAITITSAALYFLGLVNSEGDASALGLPSALFSRDL